MQTQTRFQILMLKYPGPWHISLIFERLLAREVHSLEYDPHVQYRFHQTFAIFWLIFMAALRWMPSLYDHNLASFLIEEISLYANFTTDFGSMSAALAAGNYHCQGCNCAARTVSNVPDASFTESEQKTYSAASESATAQEFNA
jgi:hypothetical protein